MTASKMLCLKGGLAPGFTISAQISLVKRAENCHTERHDCDLCKEYISHPHTACVHSEYCINCKYLNPCEYS